MNGVAITNKSFYKAFKVIIKNSITISRILLHEHTILFFAIIFDFPTEAYLTATKLIVIV